MASATLSAINNPVLQSYEGCKGSWGGKEREKGRKKRKINEKKLSVYEPKKMYNVSMQRWDFQNWDEKEEKERWKLILYTSYLQRC